MNVQWYPGHMTKAKRMMEENRKLIDLVIELVDARLPLSSRNPDIESLGRQKARLILLNKVDLADPSANEKWMKYFKDKDCHVMGMNSKMGEGVKGMQRAIEEVCKEKIQRDRKRGIQNRPVRAMVAGIPNVGKSTFINCLAKKACTKTGNRPGVTKGKQWIRLNPYVELLDTPGILWPKFTDEAVGLRLAYIGSIKDELLNNEEIALSLIDYVKTKYKGCLKKRYHLEDEGEPLEIIQEVAKNRNCLIRGKELDYPKAASLIIEDFRSGRLGRITLELPEEE